MIGKTSFAQQNNMANFNPQSGELELPEVIISSDQSAYFVTLKQLNSANNDIVFEVKNIEPIQGHTAYYDEKETRLHIPQLSVGNDAYNVTMELLTPTTTTVPLRLKVVEMEKVEPDAKRVLATVETQPVPVSGDAADDPAIWIHPTDATQSTVIGTHKLGGLEIYDLKGSKLQYIPDGRLNNVDLRYNFPLGDQKVAIVAASNRSSESVSLYRVNPTTRMLENVAARIIKTELEKPYGLCMYHSKLMDKYYVFVNNKLGQVEQWEIFDNGTGLVDGRLVRNFQVSSQTEGCVADDHLGYFYLGEEMVGIWKFNAEPMSETEGYLMDKITAMGGHIHPELEGLTIYYLNENQGYIIASNQGDNSYTVYNRHGNNDYLGTFKIVNNLENNIDAVYDTDGIDVTNVNLGKGFSCGMLVVQDGHNLDDNQNFKFVPWDNIAKALNLEKSSTYSPR